MSTVINDQNVKPGCIYRISLEDFLTYRQVELFPDTGLNLIIGPNGTGKSTFVCAIILGLCGKITAIGRSKILSDYIRSGCSEARIELELYRNPGETNIIITRRFTMDGTSLWYINHKLVREKQVQDVISTMNIQVDNLCQLLPQDRVQDFAKMDSRQLLRSTLLAVGGQRSIEQLDELIEGRTKQREISGKSFATKQYLFEQIRLNERLKIKIDSMAERKELEKKINICENKMLWVKYEALRMKTNEFKSEKEAADMIVKGYKFKLEPLEKEVEEVKKKLTAIEEQKLKDTRKTITLKEKSEEYIEGIRSLDYKLKDAEISFQQKLEHNKNRKTEIHNAQTRYNKLILDKESLVATVGDMQKVKMDLAEIESPMAKTKSAIDQVKKKKLQILYDLDSNIIPQIRLNQNKIRSLEDIDRKRLDAIRQYSNDCYQAVLWYRQNKSMFSSPSFEPMLLEINFKEPKFAQYLESTVSVRDLVAFTFESTSDMNLFLTTVRQKMGLRLVNAICSKESNNPFNHPCPIDELRYLGFYTYLSDTLTAPNAIMNYLYRQYRIHRIPIGNDHTYKNSGKVPDNISFFFTEKHRFAVRVSAYSGAKSSSISEIRPAKLLANIVDIVEVNNYKKQLNKHELTVKSHNEKIKIFDQKLEQLEEGLSQFNARRKVIQDGIEKVQTITVQIKMQLEKLQHLKREEILNIDEEKLNCKQKQRKILLKQMEMIKELTKVAKAMQTATLNADVWKLKSELSRHSIVDKQAKLREVESDYNNALVILENVNNKLTKARDEAKVKLGEAKRACGNKLPGDPGFQYADKFRTLPTSLVELEQHSSELQTRLMCMAPEEDSVIKEYEEREKTIKKLNEESLDSEMFNRNIEMKLNTIKNQWLPPLEQLLQKINTRFSKMFEELGCAGEVKLDKGGGEDEFDKYGISIQVSFRSEERLQQLTAHTQSGGERALCTAIYLLALQRISTVPFRCVDEINQGMDPVNERKMFQLLVKVTTQSDNAQYFLLTPKLLPNLEFDKKAIIHTIMNGKKIIGFNTANICSDVNRFVKNNFVANLTKNKGIAGDST